MNPYEQRLKRCITIVRQRCGNFCCSQLGLNEFFQQVLQPDDGPDVVAAKALEYMCSDGGKYDRAGVTGVMAVIVFLGELSDISPENDNEKKKCGLALVNGDFTRVRLLAWIGQWYRLTSL
jgi:hypothetical protein